MERQLQKEQQQHDHQNINLHDLSAESAMMQEERRHSCSTKLREASEIIDRLFSCGVKVLPVMPSSSSSSSRECQRGEDEKQQPSPTTVKKKSSYMMKIQALLDSKTPEEGTKYLKSTVVDLLHEVEVLKLDLESGRQQITTLKKEVDASKQKDMDRIDTLVKALQMATLTNGDRQSPQQQQSTHSALSPEKIENLNGEEASLMTISVLTRKIEELSIRNSKLVHEKEELMESMEDVQAASEAKDMKIKALESQFKSINRTRQKVVHKLGLSGSEYKEEASEDTCSSNGSVASASPRESAVPSTISSKFSQYYQSGNFFRPPKSSPSASSTTSSLSP